MRASVLVMTMVLGALFDGLGQLAYAQLDFGLTLRGAARLHDQQHQGDEASTLYLRGQFVATAQIARSAPPYEHEEGNPRSFLKGEMRSMPSIEPA